MTVPSAWLTSTHLLVCVSIGTYDCLRVSFLRARNFLAELQGSTELVTAGAKGKGGLPPPPPPPPPPVLVSDEVGAARKFAVSALGCDVYIQFVRTIWLQLQLLANSSYK